MVKLQPLQRVWLAASGLCFRFGMVKLQLDGTTAWHLTYVSFPLWHGKVATEAAMRIDLTVLCFRFGMVKLQPEIILLIADDE